MAEIYGTTGSVPGDSTTVRSGGTVAVGVAFTTTVGLVGGMDTANGSATTGEVTTVASSADAAAKFGENSELKEQVDLAFANGAGTIYAVPVAETSVTGEDPSSGTTGQLANAPVFDPRVHDEHEITDQGGEEINISDDVASETVSGTEAYVNPTTGEFKGDSGTTYTIDYSYGEYQPAIQEVVTQVPRAVGVLTESTSVANDLLTELNSYDTDFGFMQGYVGASRATDATGYSDSFDDRRLSVIAGPRGYTDTAESNEVRTVGAVAGKQAGKPLGDSTTYEGLAGLASLNTSYTNTEVGNLIDSQVYPLANRGGITVMKDMTTSTDPQFERVAFSEITDEATELTHIIAQDFIGKANTGQNRLLLAESVRSSLSELEDDNLLDNYFVSVSEGANDNEVTLDIGLDIVGYMDRINVTITVGDVITNEGAA